MAKPNLHLVTPDLIRGPAFDPSQLAPAECDQEAPPKDRYIAAWMIEEGERAFADRRAVRRLRWTLRLVVAAAWLGGAWAAWRLL